MSKRGGTELNHENWNQDDEPEEAGTFRKAGEGQLKGRVIKKARRRAGAGEEGEKKNVFSGFGGFAAKPAAEAFSFLSGNNPPTEPTKTESSGGGSSFVFGSAKSSSSTASTGFSFGSVTSGAAPAKPSFSFGNTENGIKKDPAPVFGAFGTGNGGIKDTEAKTENTPVFGAFGTGNDVKKDVDIKPSSTPVFGAFGAGNDSKKDSNSNSSSVSLFGSKPTGSETVAPAPTFGSFAFGAKKVEDPKPVEKTESSSTAVGGDLMSSFKPSPGWSCTTCMVSNPQEKVSCLACETPKPGHEPPKEKAVVAPTPSFGSGGGFKFGGSNSEVKPSTDSSSSSSTGFSFGATSGKTDTEPKVGAGFAFGTSSNQVSKPSAAVTGFAFGAKKETSSEKSLEVSNDGKTDEKPSGTANFSFGAKTSDDKSNSSGGFGFGASSKPVDKPAAAVSSFSFGSNGGSKDEKEKDVEKIAPAAQLLEVEQEPNTEFLSHLKALNNQVLAWVKQHLEQNPLVLLTPVFKDYDKHLAEISSKYGDKPSDTNSRPSSSSISALKSDIEIAETAKPTTSEPAIGQTAFGASSTKSSSAFTFGSSSNDKPASSTAAPFSFGQVATVKPAAAASMFGSSTANSSVLGSGNLFSFNSGASTTTTPSTQQKEEEDEDNPPVVEIKQVTEDDAVYSKKCKLFYKKDGQYVEKGVGMLYLKEVEGGRHQLLVRADTNLGNVLLNILLSPQIPTTRVGKNNVMLVCVPNPPVDPKADASAPCPMLIRVKNGEDADELKEKLDELKEEK